MGQEWRRVKRFILALYLGAVALALGASIGAVWVGESAREAARERAFWRLSPEEQAQAVARYRIERELEREDALDREVARNYRPEL